MDKFDDEKNVSYDTEEIFEEKLKPLIKRIKVFCLAHRIPMFMTFAIKNDENGTTYKSDMVLAASHRELSDNRIGDLLLQLNDFDMNKTPEWVKRDIEELERYIANVKADNKAIVDTSLTRDRIDECNEITNKGRRKKS